MQFIRTLQNICNDEHDDQKLNGWSFLIPHYRAGVSYDVPLKSAGNKTKVTSKNLPFFLRRSVKACLLGSSSASASVEDEDDEDDADWEIVEPTHPAPPRPTTSVGSSSFPFSSFLSGVNEIVPLRFLQIFTAEQLQRVVCGTPLDSSIAGEQLLPRISFDAFRWPNAEKLKGWMRQYVSSLSGDKLESFLQFVTASRRLPPKGIEALDIHIQQDVVRPYPHASTCYSTLSIPWNYQTYSDLETELNNILSNPNYFASFTDE